MNSTKLMWNVTLTICLFLLNSLSDTFVKQNLSPISATH